MDTKKLLVVSALIFLNLIAVAGEWGAVKNSADVVEGEEYIIVCPTSNTVMGAQAGETRKAVSNVGIADDVISSLPDGAAIVTLEAGSGNRWYLKVNDGYLSSRKEGTLTTTDASQRTSFIITVEEDVTTIKCSSEQWMIRYNANMSEFGCYTSYRTVQLFKNNDTRVKTSLSFPENSYSVELGGEFVVPELIVTPADARNEVVFSSSDENIARVDSKSGAVTALSVGTATITASIPATSENFRPVSASYTLSVTKPVSGASFEDILTCKLFGLEGSQGQNTTYSSCNYTNEIGISFAAVMSCSYMSVQIRSNDSKSGIVVTANPEGYLLRSVEVDWNTNTLDARVLQVYGKDTPYSGTNGASDLYSNATAGELLGTISRTGGTKLVINGDYPYIGLRSANGAMYMTTVTLVWEKESGEVEPTVTPQPVIIGGDKTKYSDGDEIRLECADAEAGIYFTLDGSEVYIDGYGYVSGVGSKGESVVSRSTLSVDNYSSTGTNLYNPEYPIIYQKGTALNLTYVAYKPGLEPSEPVRFYINEEGTTALSDVAVDSLESGSEYFTIQGVRLPAAPTQSGIYILRNASGVRKIIVR